MAQEFQQRPLSPTELFKAAEAVARSGRGKTVQLLGKTLTIMADVPVSRRRAARRGKQRENAFLAASGTLPPLTPPRDINEMTEIAAEEGAHAAAREGLQSDDHS